VIAETIVGQIAAISTRVGFLHISSDSASIASHLAFNSLVRRTDNLRNIRSAHASFLHDMRYCPMMLDTSADGDGDDDGDNEEYNAGEDCKLLRYLQILAALAHAFATTAVAVAVAAATAAAAAAAAAAAVPSLPPPLPKLPPPTAAFSPPPFLDLDSFYLLLTFLKSTCVYSRELLYCLFMFFVQS
jgi:hypothetical protein